MGFLTYQRFLEWFDKAASERLVGEEPVPPSVQFQDLQRLFPPPPHDPLMLDVCKVEPLHAAWLRRHFQNSIDLTNYDYFFATYRKP